MQNSIKNTQIGVGYNNTDNKDNKENKDKACRTNNAFLLSSSGREALASLFPEEPICGETPSRAEPDLPQCNSQSTPILNEDLIKRAVIQLFDNGETSSQRYKLKLKFNLVDGENPEFVASLTKDMRNFMKYIPEDGKDDVVHFAKQITTNIKYQFNSKPYIGKFHLNQGKGRHIHSQTEPYTAVAVWWDLEHKAWAGVIMFYDWMHQFDLFNEYITDAQAKNGLKGQSLFINLKHDTRIRPKTWAEQRTGK